MDNIREMLVESSVYLYGLMKILIKLFCDLINRIFDIIKAKLLYFLKRLELLIDLDMFLLHLYMELYNRSLSKLQSEVDKSIQILKIVNGLLKALARLTKHNKNFNEYTNYMSCIETISKLYQTFSHQNDKISKTLHVLSSIKLEKYIQSRSDISHLYSLLKKDLVKLNEHTSDIIKITIDLSLINKFTESLKSIKNVFQGGERNDIFYLLFSKEIISIKEQLYIIEQINLWKLYVLITQIQIKYFDIFIKGQLLFWTIEFYQEIKQTITSLIKLMKFESCNAQEFLTTCSSLEIKCHSILDKIHECIKKLRDACKNPKCLGVPKELLKLYSTIIGRISKLKFYVDLMAMEILIFKMIIMTLIQMTVSSVFIDQLIVHILQKITDIDNAITKLRDCQGYLQTFHYIQLQNTLTILGVSSRLLFSKYIHQYYYVLLFNLDLINRLIWAVECYIHHLLVFRHVTNSLNSLSSKIVDLGEIIVQISNVAISTTKIIEKLNSVNKSITELNKIQDKMDITNWKESAQGIRDQIKLINDYIVDINSELNIIKGYLGSISKSFLMLKYLESFLKVLITQVLIYIKYTDNKYRIGVGIENPYFYGLIMSIVGPCNKQLKFILGYLLLMYVVMRNLINVIETSIVLIIVNVGWLYGLTKVLNKHIDNINKGVVDLECAIEGVARNLVRCSLQSTNNSKVTVINDNNINKNEKVNNGDNNKREFNLYEYIESVINFNSLKI